LDTGKLASTLAGHSAPINQIMASRDSLRVTSIDEDFSLVWDTQTLMQVKGVKLLCGGCCWQEHWASHALAVSRNEVSVELGEMNVGLTLDGLTDAWADESALDVIFAADVDGSRITVLKLM